MEDKQPIPYTYPVLLILKEELVWAGSLIVKPLPLKEGIDAEWEIKWDAKFIHYLTEDAVHQLVDLGYIDEVEEGHNLFSNLNFLLLPEPNASGKCFDKRTFSVISKSKGEDLCLYRTLIDVLRCHDAQPL